MELVTPRLRLREFVAADYDAVHAYASDPVVVRRTGWGPNSPQETVAFLAGTAREAAAAPRTEYTLGIVDRARVLVKLGMHREGFLRQHLLIRGDWRDRLLFAALRSDS